MTISDEFTYAPMSRQLKYQKRKARDSKCIICGKEAVTAVYCKEHIIMHRKKQRIRLGSTKRYRCKIEEVSNEI